MKNKVYNSKGLNKSDLLMVIINGLSMTLILAVAVAAFNLVTILGMQYIFAPSLLLIAYFLPKSIRKSYEDYHIAYSIIAIILFLIGYYISNVIIVSFLGGIKAGFSLGNLRSTFMIFWPFTKAFYNFATIILLIVVVISMVMCYKISRPSIK